MQRPVYVDLLVGPEFADAIDFACVMRGCRLRSPRCGGGSDVPLAHHRNDRAVSRRRQQRSRRATARGRAVEGARAAGSGSEQGRRRRRHRHRSGGRGAARRLHARLLRHGCGDRAAASARRHALQRGLVRLYLPGDRRDRGRLGVQRKPAQKFQGSGRLYPRQPGKGDLRPSGTGHGAEPADAPACPPRTVSS